MMEKYGVDNSEIEVTASTSEEIVKIAMEKGVAPNQIPEFNSEKEAREFLEKLINR